MTETRQSLSKRFVVLPRCPICGTETPLHAKVCPRCGSSTSTKATPQETSELWDEGSRQEAPPKYRGKEARPPSSWTQISPASPTHWYDSLSNGRVLDRACNWTIYHAIRQNTGAIAHEDLQIGENCWRARLGDNSRLEPTKSEPPNSTLRVREMYAEHTRRVRVIQTRRRLHAAGREKMLEQAPFLARSDMLRPM
jgi:hypothetical protein